MAVDRANFIPICSYRKGKGLFSYENKPFLHPFGGDKRDRTADLLNAIQALSQAIISMPPFMSNGNDKERNFHATISIVFKNCSMLIFSVILIS